MSRRGRKSGGRRLRNRQRQVDRLAASRTNVVRLRRKVVYQSRGGVQISFEFGSRMQIGGGPPCVVAEVIAVSRS